MESIIHIKVRYAETDQMGIVYHANYAVWLEIGRTNLLENLGFSYSEIEDMGYLSPVVSLNITYNTPLKYGDTAVVITKLSKVTPIKTVYSYLIYKEDENLDEKPCIVASTTHCIVSKKDFKPVNQKKELPELYKAYSQALQPNNEG